MTLYIGDVHGKYNAYKRILKGSSDTIQVGDMGVGFLKLSGGEMKHSSNPPYDIMVKGNHRFIRGNHDNPTVCKNHTQYIPDGTYENGTMYIGGAVSVDKAFRTEGVDYWTDEELSYTELQTLIDKYLEVKPEVMVTHDCPDEFAHAMCAHTGRTKLDIGSRSREAFQAMWNMHKPRLWVYGHWHFSFEALIEGTRFVCLAELEVKDL